MKDRITVQAAGRDVVVTHPSKLLIPDARVHKLDLVNYYLAVADGALRGAGGRPCVLVRYPDGIGGEFFFQKRAPAQRPEWLEVASIRFPSGRSADEVVPRHPADLAWMANLACLELHPHPVRADDLEHPDELRVDLDPVPGVEWPQIRQVAQVVHEALADVGLTGWPKTSGSRGVHVLVRIERRWSFDQVRRAALALARDVERRAPGSGHQRVVEGGAPRSLRGLQPEREGPHRELGLFGTAEARRACVGAGELAGTGRLRPRRLHAVDHAEAIPAPSAIRTRPSMPGPTRWSGCSSFRRAMRPKARAMRRGRRTTARRRASPSAHAPRRRGATRR